MPKFDDAKTKVLVDKLTTAAQAESKAVDDASANILAAKTAAETKAAADAKAAGSQATVDNYRAALKDAIDELKTFADNGFESPEPIDPGTPGNGDGTGITGDVGAAASNVA
jgi:membrane protein involved in colicin uptake